MKETPNIKRCGRSYIDLYNHVTIVYFITLKHGTWVFILQLGYRFTNHCTIYMSLLLIRLVTLPVHMDNSSLYFECFIYIYGDHESMLPSHHVLCYMINVIKFEMTFWYLVNLSSWPSLFQFYSVLLSLEHYS